MKLRPTLALFFCPLFFFLNSCTATGVREDKQSDMYRDLLGLTQESATFVAIGTELRITTKGNFGYHSGITASDAESWATGWVVDTKLPQGSITKALFYADTLSAGANTAIDMSTPPQVRLYTDEGKSLNDSGVFAGWGSGAYPVNLLPYLNQKIIPVIIYSLTDGRKAYTIYPTITIHTTD